MIRQDAHLRVLLFSDLHLDRTYEWAPPAVAEARRTATQEALVTILAEARRHSVDVVACAGDLFNRRTVKPATMRWLAAALRSVGVPVLIAPGNEDFIGPLGGYTSYEWPENVTVFDSDVFSPVEVVDGITIWGAAHTEAHRSRSFLNGFKADRPGMNIALFHGAETSGRDREPDADPCAELEEAEIERAGFDHGFLGHYQQPHLGRMHTYPGTPIAHAFGPGGTRGAVVVTLGGGGSIEREIIPVPSSELHDIEVNLSGTRSKPDALRRVKDAVSGQAGVIRLTFAGRLPPDIVLSRDDFAGMTSSLDSLIIRWETDVDVDLNVVAEEPTIRGQFVRDGISSELSDERRQRVLLIGLRALAGHDEPEGPR